MENQIVMAVSEPLKPKQVIRWTNGRRLYVVRQLTREEYESKRRENAALREARGLKREALVNLLQGDDTMHLDIAPDPHPVEPPADCQHFYLVREV